MNTPTLKLLSPENVDGKDAAPLSGLDTLLGYALRLTQMKVFQRLVDSLAPYDLRPAQFSALAIIGRHPGSTQAELAKALNIEPPQMVPLLNKLEGSDLAVRVRNKVDKRSYGLYLSKRGERLLSTLYEVAEKSDREATPGLNDVERRQLVLLLSKACQGT